MSVVNQSSNAAGQAVSAGILPKFRQRVNDRSQPIVMHPAVFIGGFVALGLLFAAQTIMGDRMMSFKFDQLLLLKAWGAQYFLWGVLCWLLWFWLGPRIQTAPLPQTLAIAFPLSFVVTLCEEVIWVSFFPEFPLRRRPMSYLDRLAFQLSSEFLPSLLIFWCTFFLVRGIGYYQRFRENENVARKLEAQLSEAKLRALRMQLNPHFLFNTLNGISSLMRIDVNAADVMLEQLASLLRITLDRGEIQLIRLLDEMEYVEMYMALQQQRFAGRMHQEISIGTGLHDALVPAMILQPIIENAYAHGLTHSASDGLLLVSATRDDNHLILSVLNNGLGLHPDPHPSANAGGVGLKNVQTRLRLHYGDDQQFTLQQLTHNKIEAKITIPLELSREASSSLKGYGV